MMLDIKRVRPPKLLIYKKNDDNFIIDGPPCKQNLGFGFRGAIEKWVVKGEFNMAFLPFYQLQHTCSNLKMIKCDNPNLTKRK